MTKFGVNFILFFAILVFFGVATGLREIFFLAFLCGILILFAGISAIVGILTLSTKQETLTPFVIRKEKAKVVYSLKGFIPFPIITTIKIKLFDGTEETHMGVSFFGKHSKIKIEPDCPHRGEWFTSIIGAQFTDMFGFFRVKTSKKLLSGKQAQITVFPILYDIPSYPLPISQSVDEKQENPIITESGDTFSDTRFYRQGDPLKRIHWKLSVRTRELHTRQYESSTEENVYIVIDTALSENSPDENNWNFDDIATEGTMMLAQYYLAHGHNITIVPIGLPSNKVEVFSTETLNAAYEMLSFSSLRSSISLVNYMPNLANEMPENCRVFMFSRDLSKTDLSSLVPYTTYKLDSTLFYYPSMSNYENPQIISKNLNTIPIVSAENILEQVRRGT